MKPYFLILSASGGAGHLRAASALAQAASTFDPLFIAEARPSTFDAGADLNARDVEHATRIIEGTARSMGIQVK